MYPFVQGDNLRGLLSGLEYFHFVSSPVRQKAFIWACVILSR